MKTLDRVQVVVPAYNESLTIGTVTRGLIDLGAAVLVVDDASTDDTFDQAKFSGASVYRNEFNCGYDGSTEIGIAIAKQMDTEIVITMDGDGQHKIEDVVRLVKFLKVGGYDVVIGERSKKPRLSEEIASKVTRLVFGIGDMTCGLRCYRKELLEEAEERSTWDLCGMRVVAFSLVRRKKVGFMTIHVLNRQGVSRYGVGWKAEQKIMLSFGRVCLYMLKLLFIARN